VDEAVRSPIAAWESFYVIVGSSAAAALSAPWPSLAGPDLALGACGLAGVAYVGLVMRRARRQSGYRPVLEDWIWHAVLPLIAYGLIGAAALTLGDHAVTALFLTGAATLLLVYIGIHNAWDTVTFIALQRSPERPEGTP
jgi:hypothetical protein